MLPPMTTPANPRIDDLLSTRARIGWGASAPPARPVADGLHVKPSGRVPGRYLTAVWLVPLLLAYFVNLFGGSAYTERYTGIALPPRAKGGGIASSVRSVSRWAMLLLRVFDAGPISGNPEAQAIDSFRDSPSGKRV